MAKREDAELFHLLSDDDDETIADASLNHNLSTESKTTDKRPKLILKCVVCGDNAYGYNFDAISCESCKAFFRRNALRPPGRLKCRGDGHCEIVVETRKRCKKCRLEKCFKMGMRKEWILSEEEKGRKRQKIEDNRRLKQTTDTVPRRRRRTQTNSRTDNSSSGDGSPPPPPSPPKQTNDLVPLMTDVDWTKIQQVQTAYSDAMALNQVSGVPLYPATHSLHSTLDLIRIPTYLSSIRLITYIKKLPEFHLFDNEDRVTLIKHNLLAAVFMHIVLIYDPVADIYHEHDTQDPIFQGKDWIEILGENFYHDLTSTVIKLIRILEYDRVIVKLLLLIILYIKGYCAYDILHEPSLNNMSIVFNAQNAYVETLYKYCLHQYGYNRTISLFTNLTSSLLAIQRLSIHLKDFVQAAHIDPAQLSPLMHSILQLSDTSSSS